MVLQLHVYTGDPKIHMARLGMIILHHSVRVLYHLETEIKKKTTWEKSTSLSPVFNLKALRKVCFIPKVACTGI